MASKEVSESKIESSDEENRIPMADEITDEDDDHVIQEQQQQATPSEDTGRGGPESLTSINILEPEDCDLSNEEQEEKARLIAQVLELQNTLDDLSSRVDNVKEENLRLRSENQVISLIHSDFISFSHFLSSISGFGTVH